SSELVREIRDWRPHVLHLICRGGVGSGGSYLQIGTRVDAVLGQQESLFLTGYQLIEHLRNLQLVILTEHTIPPERAKVSASAVIAPRRPFADEAMQLFARSFYRRLSQTLSRADWRAPEVTLDWAQLISEVRKALAHSRRDLAWSMPALYTRNL